MRAADAVEVLRAVGYSSWEEVEGGDQSIALAH